MMPLGTAFKRACTFPGLEFGRTVVSCVRSGVCTPSPGHKEQPMDGVLKKGVGLLVIVFLLFWLVQDPSGFAHSAKSTGANLWDLLTKLFDSSISFIKSLSK
jgi:hypothetical protein